MIQSELWILTPLIMFVFTKVPVLSEKSERKLNDDNFIITHYGVEYYTPATDEDMKIHNNGYYEADVIPVDVHTGEELKEFKSVNNVFVPLHTGYAIGVDDSKEIQKKNDQLENNENNQTSETKTEPKEESKSKVPKKYVKAKPENIIKIFSPGGDYSKNKNKVPNEEHLEEVTRRNSKRNTFTDYSPDHYEQPALKESNYDQLNNYYYN